LVTVINFLTILFNIFYNINLFKNPIVDYLTPKNYNI
jgi:hypothetical protein